MVGTVRRPRFPGPGAFVRRALPLVAVCALAAGCVAEADAGPEPAPAAKGSPAPSRAPVPTGLDQLDHLIFIVQENRSFDHYFGTFPGADGLEFRADGK